MTKHQAVATLAQFVLRTAFGLAAAMAVTSPRQVSSGYYRNHLYVILGLNVLGALAIGRNGSIGLMIAAAVIAYLGSVLWLYEKPRLGITALVLIAVVDLAAAWLAGSPYALWLARSGVRIEDLALSLLDPVSGGFVLGTTLAAMFLGHWYLNSPSMELAPLQRLVRLMIAAVLLRGAVCGAGLWLLWDSLPGVDGWMLYFLPLRWLFGILAPLLLAWMTLRTLDVPNTQSATGILYVAVIAVFTGELCGQLLSGATMYPL